MLLFWVILTVTLMVGISAIMVKQVELFWAKNLVGPLISSYTSVLHPGCVKFPFWFRGRVMACATQQGADWLQPAKQGRGSVRAEFLSFDTTDNCAALFFVVAGEEGCPVSCRMPGSTPALCPLGASSNLSRDNQKCLQTLPDVSWGWGRQIE